MSIQILRRYLLTLSGTFKGLKVLTVIAKSLMVVPRFYHGAQYGRHSLTDGRSSAIAQSQGVRPS